MRRTYGMHCFRMVFHEFRMAECRSATQGPLYRRNAAARKGS